MYKSEFRVSPKVVNDGIIHFLFFVLFILSVVFYKERIFTDSGYYLFHVVNSGRFHIEHMRIILAFSQILPLIGIYLHLSLKTIILLYSVNHVLFFYSIFLIARYGLKSEKAGYFLILIQTVGIASSYFVPMFELLYSFGFLLLFILILKRNLTTRNLILLSVLEIIMVLGHPYSNFIILFVLAFDVVENRTNYWKYIVFGLIMVGLFFLKKAFATSYQIGKTEAFIYNLQHAVYNFGYVKSLGIFLFRYYKGMIVMFLVSFFYLIFSKKYAISIVYLLGFLAMLVLVNISYYGFQPSRYHEQVYLPLTVITIFVFYSYLIENKNINKSYAFVALAVLIFAFRIGAILKASPEFTERTHEMEQLIKESRSVEGSKFVVKQADMKSNANWSLPIETMLLSAADSVSGTVTICSDIDYKFKDNYKKLKSDEYLFRRWEIYPDSSLNHRYFFLKNGKYKFLK